jgi:hypothetical protein
MFHYPRTQRDVLDHKIHRYVVSSIITYFILGRGVGVGACSS